MALNGKGLTGSESQQWAAPQTFFASGCTSSLSFSWEKQQSPRGIETGSLYQGSFGLMRLTEERGRISLELAVSYLRGTEKLEKLSTLKTSPGTQQFYLLAGN